MVYVFGVPEDKIKYCDSDAVSVIANLCKVDIKFSIRNICHLDRDDFNEVEDIKYFVHEIKERKFLIPHDAKQNILRELDILNINEAFVYPDFEHISTYIRER